MGISDQLDMHDSLHLLQFADMYCKWMERLVNLYFPDKRVKIDRSDYVDGHGTDLGQNQIEKYFDFVPVAGRAKHARNPSLLGQGSFGEVWLVERKETGVRCALKKQMMPPGADFDRFLGCIRREVGFLRLLDHPNVLKVFEMFVVSRENHRHAVTTPAASLHRD